MRDAFVTKVLPHSWHIWLFVWFGFRSFSGIPLLLASLVTNGFWSASLSLSGDGVNGKTGAAISSDGAGGGSGGGGGVARGSFWISVTYRIITGL